MSERIDKAIPQGADGHLDQAQVNWLRLMPDGWDGTPPTLVGQLAEAHGLIRDTWLELSMLRNGIVNVEMRMAEIDALRERIEQMGVELIRGWRALGAEMPCVRR